MTTYLNPSGPAGGYYTPPNFLFSTYEQVLRTYPVRTSGSTCISLVLCMSLCTPCRHRQCQQTVSRRSLSPDGLLGRWSRSGVEKCRLTLPAIASHVSSALQPSYVITASHWSIDPTCVLEIGPCRWRQCALLHWEHRGTHNTLLLLRT